MTLYKRPRETMFTVFRRFTFNYGFTVPVGQTWSFFTPQDGAQQNPPFGKNVSLLTDTNGSVFGPMLATFSQYWIRSVRFVFRPVFTNYHAVPVTESSGDYVTMPYFYWYVDRSADNDILQNPIGVPVPTDNQIWPGSTRGVKRARFIRPISYTIRRPSIAYPVPRTVIAQDSGGVPQPIANQVFDYKTRRSTWLNCRVMGDNGTALNNAVPHYGHCYGWSFLPPLAPGEEFLYSAEVEYVVSFRRTIL